MINTKSPLIGMSGKVTLVNGTATIENDSVTANSMIFLTAQIPELPGYLYVLEINEGVSFTIESSNSQDQSVVAWLLVEKGD